jgi:hypothetical protein
VVTLAVGGWSRSLRRGRATAGPQALRAFAAATQPVYEAISQDPLLPSELLPDDWPGPELGAALQAAHRALGPAAVAYVHTLPSTHPNHQPRRWRRGREARSCFAFRDAEEQKSWARGPTATRQSGGRAAGHGA